SCTNLASMIVPRSGGKQLFTYYRYNSYIQNALESRYGKEVSNTYFSDYLLSPDGAYLDPIVNIGNQLSRVYILTGPYTASASEALISGLRPYMEVITIGKTTYGKNVASISIYDETNSENMWGLQPIVAKVYNSLDASDYTGGFEATIPADEVQAGARALGDRQEELLSVALSDIQGQATLRGATSEQAIGMSLRRIPSNRYGDHRGLVLPSMQVFE
ncbi:MAG: S41 family peptidase, partial [Bacteroidales bacterium]|nr:S41 family peptidase [Bacteroidales bacterium]